MKVDYLAKRVLLCGSFFTFEPLPVQVPGPTGAFRGLVLTFAGLGLGGGGGGLHPAGMSVPRGRTTVLSYNQERSTVSVAESGALASLGQAGSPVVVGGVWAWVWL